MTREELYSNNVFMALADSLDEAVKRQFVCMNNLTGFLAEDRSMDVEFRGKIISLAMEINNLLGIEQKLIKTVEALENDTVH